MNPATHSAPEPLADDSSDDEMFAALSAASAATGGVAGVAGVAGFNGVGLGGGFGTDGPVSARSSGTFLQAPVASSSSLWSSSDEEDAVGGGYGDDSWQGGYTPRTPSTPKMVGRFLIGAKIGEGAYASVREGLNMDTLRIVAVKIVDLRRLRKVRGGIENVKLEIKVQKALKRHPNVIELIGVHEDVHKAKMYIFLEMANGCTLQELLEMAPDKRLPSSQVAFFLNQTVSGLAYMHRRGVIHRDIKPSNLMLTASGELKIADFGVAEFLDKYELEDSVTRTTGSPAFQAPEIAKGEDGYSGMKVDVWALGISAYFLLVGQIPFQGDTLVALFNAIAEGKYTEPTNADESVRDALRKMLEVDWHKRIGVEELLKHPWIARAGRAPPQAIQEEEGWVPIPCKQFSVLDLAQRLVDDSKSPESPEELSTTVDPTSKPSAELRARKGDAVSVHATMLQDGPQMMPKKTTSVGSSQDEEIRGAQTGVSSPMITVESSPAAAPGRVHCNVV